MVRDGKAEFQELEVWDVTAATKTYALGGQRVALRRDGTLSYVHTDHLGSASVLTDASGHEIANTRLRYYPFGAPRPDGATGTHNAFATGYSDATFTGQRRDGGTTLLNYPSAPSNRKPRFLVEIGAFHSNSAALIAPSGTAHHSARTRRQR